MMGVGDGVWGVSACMIFFFCSLLVKDLFLQVHDFSLYDVFSCPFSLHELFWPPPSPNRFSNGPSVIE